MQTAFSTEKLIKEAEESLASQFAHVDAIAFANQRRVLDAFRKHKMTEEYFAERTGYGRNDAGRAAIDDVYAEVFQAEAAAVRMQLVSGTHAIACALAGNLKSGDRLVSLCGEPYDTLKEVIGIGSDEPGSLKRAGVIYEEENLDPEKLSEEELAKRMSAIFAKPVAMIYIQKSRGYSFERRSYSNQDIKTLAAAVRRHSKDALILVDNCYGEFVEIGEPTAFGADLVAGSLIKNPGGGLAISGGYVIGKKSAVEAALNRITAPGIGGHQGLTYNQNRLVMQGLFLAPSVVSQAVKGAMLFASVFEKLGLTVRPGPTEKRFDIIQAIELGNRERLINFCRAIQYFSPVNPHVTPEPAQLEGYQDEVIMAGGTFVEGATLELSADGPLRPPFACYLQGGLSYLHVKCALEGALTLAQKGEFSFLSA